jgi:hypothetical protein
MYSFLSYLVSEKSASITESADALESLELLGVVL